MNENPASSGKWISSTWFAQPTLDTKPTNSTNFFMSKKTLIIVTHHVDCYPSMEFEELGSAKDFAEFMQHRSLDQLRPEITWETLDWKDAFRIQDAMNQDDFHITSSSVGWDEIGGAGEWADFDEEDEGAEKAPA